MEKLPIRSFFFLSLKRVPLSFGWPLNTAWEDCLSLLFDKYICPHCNNHGCSKCPRELMNIPTGNRYQIWDVRTVFGPITPVFRTPEYLAEHMAKLKWEGTDYEYDFWLKHIKQGGDSLSEIICPDDIIIPSEIEDEK